MMKMLLMLIGAGLCFAARADVGDVVASVTSPQMRMDTVNCAEVPTVITIGENAESVKIAYSGYNWHLANAAKPVTISDNGEPRLYGAVRHQSSDGHVGEGVLRGRGLAAQLDGDAASAPS